MKQSNLPCPPDVTVEVAGLGRVTLDVVYGGAFYGMVPAASVGVNLDSDPFAKVAAVADSVSREFLAACYSSN